MLKCAVTGGKVVCVSASAFDDVGSCCCVFYLSITQAVGVSAATGLGVSDFFAAVKDAVKEYHTDYKPEIDRLRQEQVRVHSKSLES